MRSGFVMLWILVVQSLIACMPPAGPVVDPVDRCYSETSRAILGKPALACLQTLDGRCVPLAPFLERCAAYWPDCVLFHKFYYWPSHIEERVAQTPEGTVSHKVRFYDNLRSTCDPDFNDSGRTHGDVAEFYDGEGLFMGLAVYMGNGLYVPLPIED